MKKITITHIEITNPLSTNNIAAGYNVGQYWRNSVTGGLFYHKTDGTWVSLIQNASGKEPPSIFLPSGANWADHLTDANIPIGWSLAAVGDTGKKLKITHNLTDVIVLVVTVKAVTTDGNLTLVPFRDAYSGIIELGNDITIQGLANNDLPLIISLIFGSNGRN